MHAATASCNPPCSLQLLAQPQEQIHCRRHHLLLLHWRASQPEAVGAEGLQCLEADSGTGGREGLHHLEVPVFP